MAITISGENNNDKILASDGVIDQISGINIVGVLTATTFSGDFIGNLTGNVTGNINNTTLLLQTGGTERVRIDSDGRVMIGTTTEGHANADNLTIATTDHTGITLRSATNRNGSVFFSDGTSGADEYRGWIQYTHTSNYLTFGTNGNERLRIDTSGRLLVGRTSGNSANLLVQSGVQVFAGVSGANSSCLSLDYNTATGSGRIMGHASSGGSLEFYTNASGAGVTPKLTIYSDGNAKFSNKLGIGGITPSNALDVQAGTTNTAIVARSTDTKAQISLVDNSTTSVGSVVVGAEGDNLFFTSGSSGAERLRITSDGKTILSHPNAVAQTPVAILDVFNQGTTTQALRVYRNDLNDNTLAAFDSYHNALGIVPKMVITSRGRVGINTNNPQREIHVKPWDNNPATAAPGYIRIDSQGSDQAAILELYHTRGNGIDKWPSSIDTVDAGLTFRVATGNNGSPQERLRITSAGKVAIGNASPQQLLHVWPDTANTTSAYVRVTSGDRNSNTGIDLGSDADGDGRLNVVSNGNLKLYTNNTERFRIDSNGRALFSRGGLTASRNVGTKTGEIQVANSGNSSAITIIGYSNDVGGPHLVFGKSRAGNATGSTILQDGDRLGEIAFCGADGTDIDSFGAAIKAHVDGTPGANDMPGRLQFYTTPDGGSGSIERLCITSDGQVQIKENAGSSGDGASLKFFFGNNNSTDVISSIIFANNVGEVASIKGHTRNGNTNGMITFQTDISGSDGERMRVNHDGGFCYGTDSSRTAEFTTPDGFSIRWDDKGQFQNSVTNTTGGLMNRKGSNGQILGFRKDGTGVGHIGVNASNMYFNFGGTTAAAHQLDDYEEGTWTPGITYASGTTVAGSNNYGYFVKVGCLVHLSATIDWTSINSSPTASYGRITGIPFPYKNASAYRASAVLTAQIVGLDGGTSGNIIFGIGSDASNNFIYITPVNLADNSGGNYSHFPTLKTSGTLFGFKIEYMTDS